MQVTVENVSNLERKITVGIPAAQIQSALDKRLNEVSRTVKLDGFRPGKVPMKVVKKRFGEAVRGEVIEKTIQDTIFEALNQEKINPAGMPSIESIRADEGQDLEYVAKFEVFPEISLCEFTQISIEKRESEVKDNDFDERLEQIRSNAKEWKEVARAAKNGDQVMIDYKGTKDGEAFDGGSAEDSPLELGSGRMIAGFEEGIVGMKAGEEKDLNLSFPDDYHSEALKGQKVVFHIMLKKVNEPFIPELNDELAKKLGVVDGLDSLKKQVRESMERELEQAIKGDIKQQVMDELMRLHEVDVPKAVVGQQIQIMKRQMIQQFGGAQIDPSIFPDDMFVDRAKENAALSLVLSKIIEAKSLAVTREAVKAYIEKMAEGYPEQKDEIVKYYMNDKQRHAEIEAVVLEEKLVELVISEAKVSTKKLDFSEAVAPRKKEDL